MALRRNRVSPMKFGPRPNINDISVISGELDDLDADVRRVVREEM